MSQELKRTLWAMVFIALFAALCIAWGWPK